MYSRFKVFAVIILLLIPHNSLGEPKKPTIETKSPKIGLVLAGGGALGFAHVGVLKVLNELHVPVHYVAGTSMGSIVGAAFAAGQSTEEMETVLSETNWAELFRDGPSRLNLPYRKKPGRDRELFGDAKLGFKNGKLIAPLGAIEGQNIVPILQRLYEKVPFDVDFDKLRIPFRAIAADIETGHAVVISKGNLATAARASMSVPGVFSPVEVDGKLLVDGGIANNLPVDITKQMGADRLIVVELYADLKKRDDLVTPLDISGQVISLLLAQNSALQRTLMGPQDILIAPDLSGYSSTDFEKARELMALGEAAARKIEDKLRALSIPEVEYAAYTKTRLEPAPDIATVDFVKVDNKSSVPDGTIKDAVGIEPGEPFDRKKVEEAIKNVYNLGDFKTVSYSLAQEDDKTGILLSAREKPYNDQYVRIGFALEDDFEGSSFYNLGVDYRLNHINEADGYLNAQGQIGRYQRLALELYQPFYAGSPFFIAPQAVLDRRYVLVTRGQDQIAEYANWQGQGTLRSGIDLRDMGEVSAGYRRGYGEFDLNTGTPGLPQGNYEVGEMFITSKVDKLDSADLPTEGYFATLSGILSDNEFGSSDDFQEVTGRVSKPFTFGMHTIFLKGEFGTTFGDRPAARSYSLGGFTDISGYKQNALNASDYVLSSIIYYQKLNKEGVSLFGMDTFGGLELDIASLRNDNVQLPDEGVIVGGAAFVGIDTPLIPAYFGFGLAEEGNYSFYLAVGRILAGMQRTAGR